MYILHFRSTALLHPTDYAMEKEHSSQTVQLSQKFNKPILMNDIKEKR